MEQYNKYANKLEIRFMSSPLGETTCVIIEDLPHFNNYADTTRESEVEHKYVCNGMDGNQYYIVLAQNREFSCVTIYNNQYEEVSPIGIFEDSEDRITLPVTKCVRVK